MSARLPPAGLLSFNSISFLSFQQNSGRSHQGREEIAVFLGSGGYEAAPASYFAHRESVHRTVHPIQHPLIKTILKTSDQFFLSEVSVLGDHSSEI